MTGARSKAGRRRCVFITGARRGIGRAIAYAFAETGHDVVINDVIDDDATRETLDGLAARGAGAHFLQGDIGDVSGHEALVARAFAAFGGLDVLVNNAGISVARRGDMLEATPESFDRLIAINLRGPFFLTQAVALRWLQGEPAPARSIINIASANAHMASIDRAEYCLSKAGVAMMTKLYALRLAEAGIGVFEIRPGVIRTDMTAVVSASYEKRIADGLTPVRRWGEPSDVGRVAVALTNGEFHFSTGEIIHVDGGLHIAHL
jgi:3-oxoacyl-[acyl-carrier protein] reductase